MYQKRFTNNKMSNMIKILFIILLLSLCHKNIFAQTTGFGNVTVTNANSNGNWTLVGTVNTFMPSANNSTVSATDIQTKLGTGDVIISTTCPSCNQVGNLTISSSIISKNNSTGSVLNRVLKLSAEKDININNFIDLAAKEGSSAARAENNSYNLELISNNGKIITSKSYTIRTDPISNNVGYKGGYVSFTAINGSVQINGAINTSARTSDGMVTIIGNNGVTISANITTSGGTTGILKITDNFNSFTDNTNYDNQGQTGGVFTIASFENAGTGVFKIKGVNVYSGNTTLSAGSLYLGAHNSVPITSNIIFNGGDFRPNGFDTKVNSIKVSANSTLTFDPLQSSIFTITDIDTTGPTVNTYLIIREWQGFSQSTALTKFGSLENASSDFVNTNGKLQSAPTPGGLNQYGQILTSMVSGASGGLKGIFQGTNNRLSDNFLRRIRFYNGTSYYSSTQISSKEIVPNAVIP